MKLRVHFLVLLGCLLFGASICHAQLIVRNVGKSPINNVHSNARVTAVGDTLELPFWDDFSFSSLQPDTSLWEANSGVFINGTLGKSSPTINVASFDGNDLFGNPYETEEVTRDTVDQLTSRPIDLSIIPDDKRNSVYLSFYWQIEGNSEIPEIKDLLGVDFKDSTGTFVNVLTLEGGADNQHEDFTMVSIQIEEAYFLPGFQFRFTSVGNNGGPYDAWHIDYVYLNQDRVADDESLEDKAVAGVPTGIFSEYTMIPYDVLFDFPDTIYKDVQYELSNLFKSESGLNPQVVEVEYTLTSYKYLNTDSVEFDTLLYILDDEDNLVVPELGRSTNSIPALNDSYFINRDSLFLQSELIFSSTEDSYFIKSIDGSTITYLEDDYYNYRLNDTVRTYFEIHQTLAYDDGVAEYAAGLNKNQGQIAVKYSLPGEDTLTHIDIYFPQIDPSPAGERIALSVMSDLSGSRRSILGTQEFVISGGAELNEFERFTFDIPVILAEGFYISMRQFTNEYIGIGLDNNNLIGLQKIFFKTEDEWQTNDKVEGMIMVRAGFADSDFVVSSVNENVVHQLSVYPNPASEVIQLKGDFDSYELLNVSGVSIASGSSNQIPVATIKDGIYLLRVATNDTISTHKVIIRH